MKIKNLLLNLLLVCGLAVVPVSTSFAKYESGSNDAQSAVIYGKYGSTLVPLNVDSDGKVAISGLSSSQISNLKIVSVVTVISGGGSAPSTGIYADVVVPFSGTITQVQMFADQTGSIVVDLWKDTYANYPPTIADSIVASAKPTLSSAIKSTDSTLTGWNTTVTAGDIIRINIDSASTLTRVSLVLVIVKS